jgi:Helix-turn-helix domain
MGADNTRFNTREKTKAVMRMLQGEEPDVLAHELGTSVERLARWKQRFTDAGEAALAQKTHRGHIWKNRAAILQWTAVVLILLVTVYVLTRFFDNPGATPSP